jgi:HAD superfamily hydrolase (TIGR01549 family)
MTRPSLALFDLDNTLVDRAGAFRTWARAFVESRGLGDDELGWLERADGDGLLPRAALFEQVRARYRLDDPVNELVAAYRKEYPRCFEPVGRETLAALGELRKRGWKIGIVSNGSPTQEAKIDAAGLREAVDGCAISEVVGARKPEPEIFHAAAELCGCVLDGAWVIGDSARADIAGAVACGLRSIWISRGRRWEVADYRPDRIADSVPEAVRYLLDGR